MKLEGIHHVTAITGDAQANVDFYAGLLGLRLVKKTVNFDAPDVYHLYYGDELGRPGSILTFFEFPGAPRGRHGAGMVYRVGWRVASEEALEFWERRVGGTRADGALRLEDPEGLELELRVGDVGVHLHHLAAAHAEIPPAHALRGFDGVRAYSAEPEASRGFLTETLGFDDGYRAGSSSYVYDPAPPERGLQGAGTVHHIAWASQDDEHEAWRERVLRGGGHPTHVYDRMYFRSIYFREPSGVLFEIATIGPGFTADEPAETLGEELKLPPQYEHLREQLERRLTPLRNPRAPVPA